ncbi:MAG: thiol reductant ABC exporter subunit CydD [Ilumatobacteraceae bacterium]
MRPIDPRLLRFAAAARRHVAVCALLGIVTAMLVLVQAELLSWCIARVVDDGVGRADIAWAFAGLGLVVVVRSAIAWFQESAARRASAQVKSQLRSAVVARAALDAAAGRPGLGRAEVATLATRGLDALDGWFGRYLPQLVLAVVVPAVVLARLLVADVASFVIVVVTLPLIPVFMVLVGRATESVNAKRWRALERLAHHFLDVVSGLTTLKAYGRATAQGASIRRSTDEYRTTTMATLRIAFLSSLVLELVATISVALVAVGVGLRLVDGGLDLRTGLLVIVITPEAYLPIREVGARFHAAAEGVAAAEAAFAIIDAPLPPVGGGVRFDVSHGVTVRVDGVCVSHPGRATAAPDGVSFEAATGEVVALTGPSGSGKSTLLAVLRGDRRPDAGTVVVGNVALADVDAAWWHAQLAWVDQHPYLFAGTVAANVRLADATASDAAVRAALVVAGLAHVDAGRVLGESGLGLSAGERRRVALARAVLRDAPVVLLDEPTAGLDEATEQEVLATIRSLATGRLVVMAAHRPAAIALAGRIVDLTAVSG